MMKKRPSLFLRILKWLAIVLFALVALFFLVRFVGQRINAATPKGGINEEMYVDINGSRQWINIYGQDLDNPVLLYLHGGPGSASSPISYAFTRKWADVYTVVTWDQRNCGKSYSEDQNSTPLTYDLMMRDGEELTKFLREYLHKDKITLLGHSWGTFYGCNLVLAHPEYYDCYIGTGQVVDFDKNEEAFQEIARTWVDDEEGKSLYRTLTSQPGYDKEYYEARQALMEKYGYDMMAEGADYNLLATQIFNPYYSLGDFYRFLKADFSVYDEFIKSDEFRKFSLLGRTEYQVPYYNINGDKDYQTNWLIAREYFDEISAPRKELFIMKDMTHGLLESRSGEFSEILHQIATVSRISSDRSERP